MSKQYHTNINKGKIEMPESYQPGIGNKDANKKEKYYEN